MRNYYSPRPHRCDTDNPTRSCCWAARNAELAEQQAAYEAANSVRIAAHGATRCPECLQLYDVTSDNVLKEHASKCCAGFARRAADGVD